MEKKQFEEVLDELAKCKPYFLCESEFQIALAETLAIFEQKNGHKQARAYLDQRKKTISGKTINPDIVITKEKFKNDEYDVGMDLVYIECKYVAVGKYISENAIVRQSSNKAVPGCPGKRYSFWEDITRMEKINKNQDDIVKKYVIFLTNDEKYWTGIPDSEASDRKLGLYNGRGEVPANLTYYTTSKGKPKELHLTLDGTYTLEKTAWQQYGNAGFRYLLIDVNTG